MQLQALIVNLLIQPAGRFHCVPFGSPLIYPKSVNDCMQNHLLQVVLCITVYYC